MPELPEVQAVVNTLQPLAGRRLGATRILRPDVVSCGAGGAGEFCRGRVVRAIRREAKRIVLELSGGRRVVFHLGMSGRLTCGPRAAPLLPHTHLRVRVAATADELRFRDPRRFGGVWLLGPDTPPAGRDLGPVGPDALQIDLAGLGRLLQRRRQIKALLLDQSAIAGLGNIYTDEVLFQAGIHPLTRADRVGRERVRRLHRALGRTLRAAIRAGGSSISDFRDGHGRRGWFQVRLKVYGRQGRPCPRCGTRLRRIRAAGRGTHICPRCQRR